MKTQNGNERCTPWVSRSIRVKEPNQKGLQFAHEQKSESRPTSIFSVTELLLFLGVFNNCVFKSWKRKWIPACWCC